MLGRQHAGKHRVMAALDARNVHKAGRAADQRAARKRQFRHGLIAALG